MYEWFIAGSVTVSFIENLTKEIFMTSFSLIYFFRIIASFITVFGFTYFVDWNTPGDEETEFWDLWFNNLSSVVTTFSTVGYGDNLVMWGDVNFIICTIVLLVFGVFLYGPMVSRIIGILELVNADTIIDEQNVADFESY